ncbi:MAG: hypothetical protein ACJATA_000014 [Sphingobacteriales bacterium]|jgi:hypothetical protein
MKNLILLAIFPALLFSTGCKFDDDDWVQPKGDGISNNDKNSIRNLSSKIISPNKIQVNFQVIDKDGKGVSDLTLADFILEENGAPIDAIESEASLSATENVYYEIKTVLLIDNSKSLSTKLSQVKDGAKVLVDNIGANQSISIYTFSEGIEKLIDFSKDKAMLAAAIDQIQLGSSSTNLYGALSQVLNTINPKFNSDTVIDGNVVLFTDGNDTQGSSTLQNTLSARGDKIVYAVALGEEIDKGVMNEIGNGKVLYSNDENELEKLFQEIQDDVLTYIRSFYFLNYSSPKRGANLHTFTLSGNEADFSSNSKIKKEFNSYFFFSPEPYNKIVDISDGVLGNSGFYKMVLRRKVDPEENEIIFHLENNYSNKDFHVFFIDFDPENKRQYSDYYNRSTNIYKAGVKGFLSLPTNRETKYLYLNSQSTYNTTIHSETGKFSNDLAITKPYYAVFVENYNGSEMVYLESGRM